MRACFVFDERASREPAARHALETLASLLEVPWRVATPEAAPVEGEAVVWVGDPAGAPSDAAAVVVLRDWPAWEPHALEVATFEGAPLPCPRGEVERAASERELPAAWLRAAAFQLGREEERIDARRDQWECYSGAYSRMTELGILDRPIVNLQAAQLARRIDAWFARRNASPPRFPRWPDGRRFAALLTHDVDDVRLHSLAQSWRLLSLARSAGSYAARAGVMGAVRALRNLARTDDPYSNFERWAEAESGHGFRSSFYVFAPHPTARHEYDALYRLDDSIRFEGRRFTVAAMLREIAGRGFEIGLHGSYRSHRDAAELALQRRQVEQATGTTVRGIRQHFLRFDPGVTWNAQSAVGFAYDTTLGYNEAIGFRAGIAAPFRPWDAGRATTHAFLELPLTLMDGTLFRTLGLDGMAAAARTGDHLDRVESAGGMAVLLWHPNAADREHFPGWWDCYLATLDELQRRGAWVTTAAEMAEYWSERTRRMTERA